MVIENAARLSIPWLVQRGIDLGIPPLLAGGSGTALYQTIGLMLGALVVQTVSRILFLRESGRVGQQVLLELRRRLFAPLPEARRPSSTTATPPVGSCPG